MDPVWITALASVIGCAVSGIAIYLLQRFEIFLLAHGATPVEVAAVESQIRALSLTNVSTPPELKSPVSSTVLNPSR